MTKIKKVTGRQVFDSRGFPTVEADVILDDGSIGSAIVPSGASTGSYEACELRDNDTKYLNKSVYGAVKNINENINQKLTSNDPYDQKKIDELIKGEKL